MTNLCKNTIQSTKNTGDYSPPLDTLAQHGTDYRKTLKKRAKAKFLSRALVLELVKIDSPLQKSYWHTWHCNNILLQDGKKITSKYCNNRWCPVCNRIRTAKLINGYMPAIEKMEDPQLVTLTIPNVKADELKNTIVQMLIVFIMIKDLFKHRRDFRINGIRKIEITYNKETDTYHPHFHIILDGRQVGEELIKEWLVRCPDANRSAQDIRPADKNSLIELFKYATKLSTKNQIIKENDKTIININPVALDHIYQALYKRRIFQTMGNIKLISEDIEELDAQIIEELTDEVETWGWEQEISDWVNSQGELLTGCEAYLEYELRVDSG